MPVILGLRLSHYPLLSGTDEDMAGIPRWTVDDAPAPQSQRDRTNWPQLARQEWGAADGLTSSGRAPALGGVA